MRIPQYRFVIADHRPWALLKALAKEKLRGPDRRLKPCTLKPKPEIPTPKPEKKPRGQNEPSCLEETVEVPKQNQTQQPKMLVRPAIFAES